MDNPNYIEHQAQFSEQGLTHFKNGTPSWVQGRLDEIAGALRRSVTRIEADATTISAKDVEIELLRQALDNVSGCIAEESNPDDLQLMYDSMHAFTTTALSTKGGEENG